MKNITYRIGEIPSVEEIIEVYEGSGITRPTTDKSRIEKMYSHSNLVVSAWDNDKLIGISRSLTDFCFACYLSDLAVLKDYQKDGIGKQLIILTQSEIGKETSLILLAAPLAMEYYPKVGFEKINNGFIISREY